MEKKKKITNILPSKTSESAYRGGIPIKTPTSAPRKETIGISNQAKIQQLHQEKGKFPATEIGKVKTYTPEVQLHVIP